MQNHDIDIENLEKPKEEEAEEEEDEKNSKDNNYSDMSENDYRRRHSHVLYPKM